MMHRFKKLGESYRTFTGRPTAPSGIAAQAMLVANAVNAMCFPAYFPFFQLISWQGFFPMKEALRNNFRHGIGRMQTKEERAAARRAARQLSRQQRGLKFQLFLHHRFVQRPLFWIGTLLGIIWAAPVTLFGLLIAIPVFVFRGHAQLIRGHTVALLVRGPFADWMLGRHPFGAMTAMALGHVVIAEKQGLSARVLTHELTHVRQAARWGIVFPFAYLASSVWAAIRGRDAYWHNRFEIAARKAEKHL